MSDYEDLLNLMHKHVSLFEELAAVEQEKLNSARSYDISALEECMKKEQAGALKLRGFDKKRQELQEKLSLKDMTFRQILPLTPEELQYEFSQVYYSLEGAYKQYQSNSEAAKQAIEINIHRIGVVLESLQHQKRAASGTVYSPDGAVKSEKLSFRDLKI